MAALIYGRQRATWILNHAGPFAFQRTRGQKLQAELDDRERTTAGVNQNIHIQGITERLFLRKAESRAAILELMIIVAAAAIFPIAWPAGRLLYHRLAHHIETRLGVDPNVMPTIPITALCWIGAAIMSLGAAVIDPSSATSLVGVVLAPWITIQGSGIFVVAGIYGALEGWLAVPGSTDWWPFPPPPLPSTPSFGKQHTDNPAPLTPGDKPTPPLRSPRRTAKRPWED
jgi:hypothetical protein